MDSLRGFVSKSNGSVVKTIDGGSTWITLTSPFNSKINSLRFANDTLGYAGSNAGLLAKTVNGGLSWSIENSGTINDITELYVFGDAAYFRTSSFNEGLYKNSAKIQGIKENTLKDENISIYPNPVSDILKISFERELKNSVVVISNLLGQEILKQETSGSEIVLNLDSVNDGVYLLQVKNVSRNVSKKIVIAH